MDAWTIKDVADVGTNVLLTFFIAQLWMRLNKVTDAILEERKQAAAERVIIAQKAGLSSEELAAQAALQRWANDQKSA